MLNCCHQATTGRNELHSQEEDIACMYQPRPDFATSIARLTGVSARSGSCFVDVGIANGMMGYEATTAMQPRNVPRHFRQPSNGDEVLTCPKRKLSPNQANSLSGQTYFETLSDFLSGSCKDDKATFAIITPSKSYENSKTFEEKLNLSSVEHKFEDRNDEKTQFDTPNEFNSRHETSIVGDNCSPSLDFKNNNTNCHIIGTILEFTETLQGLGPPPIPMKQGFIIPLNMDLDCDIVLDQKTPTISNRRKVFPKQSDIADDKKNFRTF